MVKRLLKDHPYKMSIAWALVIFILCATPGRFVPSANWLEMLSFDKWVHAGVFFLLVTLFGIAVRAHQQNRTLFYLYFVLAVVYGGLLEIMQARVFSERSADWYDVIANSFGCLVALFLSARINRRIFK
jgi:VanZ family protein